MKLSLYLSLTVSALLTVVAAQSAPQCLVGVPFQAEIALFTKSFNLYRKIASARQDSALRAEISTVIAPTKTSRPKCATVSIVTVTIFMTVSAPPFFP